MPKLPFLLILCVCKKLEGMLVATDFDFSQKVKYLLPAVVLVNFPIWQFNRDVSTSQDYISSIDIFCRITRI